MTELNDEEVNHIISQFEMSLNGLLQPLCLYGQTEYVASVKTEITQLAWQLHWKLAGADIPYEFEVPHW